MVVRAVSDAHGLALKTNVPMRWVRRRSRGTRATDARHHATPLTGRRRSRGLHLQGLLRQLVLPTSTEQPLHDPRKRIFGRITGADGLPYAGALVALFSVETNAAVALTRSAEDGLYSFPRNSYDTSRYFVAAWTTSGQPYQSLTVRTLLPE